MSVNKQMSDKGLKRKQGEMDMHDSNESQKLTCAVEENTYEAEEVKKLDNVFMFIKLTFLIVPSTNVRFLLVMKKKVFIFMCVFDNMPPIYSIC